MTIGHPIRPTLQLGWPLATWHFQTPHDRRLIKRSNSQTVLEAIKQRERRPPLPAVHNCPIGLISCRKTRGTKSGINVIRRQLSNHNPSKCRYVEEAFFPSYSNGTDIKKRTINKKRNCCRWITWTWIALLISILELTCFVSYANYRYPSVFVFFLRLALPVSVSVGLCVCLRALIIRKIYTNVHCNWLLSYFFYGFAYKQYARQQPNFASSDKTQHLFVNMDRTY